MFQYIVGHIVFQWLQIVANTAFPVLGAVASTMRLKLVWCKPIALAFDTLTCERATNVLETTPLTKMLFCVRFF